MEKTAKHVDLNMLKLINMLYSDYKCLFVSEFFLFIFPTPFLVHHVAASLSFWRVTFAAYMPFNHRMNYNYNQIECNKMMFSLILHVFNILKVNYFNSHLYASIRSISIKASRINGLETRISIYSHEVAMVR